MYPRNAPAQTVVDPIGDPDQAVVAADTHAPGLPPNAQIERRTDRRASRARWQHDERDEAVMTLPL